MPMLVQLAAKKFRECSPLPSTEDNDHRESTPPASAAGGIRGRRVYDDNVADSVPVVDPLGSFEEGLLEDSLVDHRLRGMGGSPSP